MTPQEFCYWLQGRAELLPDQPPSEAEWKMIREHLALVFKKVTPQYAPNDLQKLQDAIGKKGPERAILPQYPQPGWDRPQCTGGSLQSIHPLQAYC